MSRSAMPDMLGFPRSCAPIRAAIVTVPMLITALVLMPASRIAGEVRAESNRPPVVAVRPIYHSYPGYLAEFLGASDPEGDRLIFQALELPPGASIEEETGVLRWTPGPGQLGPFYLAFSVTDEADPPNRVGGRVVFQVHPIDGCTRALCDPAPGCEPGLAPLADARCGPRPPQVPEPDVGWCGSPLRGAECGGLGDRRPPRELRSTSPHSPRPGRVHHQAQPRGALPSPGGGPDPRADRDRRPRPPRGIRRLDFAARATVSSSASALASSWRCPLRKESRPSSRSPSPSRGA